MSKAKEQFVHLHFHTQYSLLDGACRVKDAVEKAARLGMPALAMTDHGVMYGAIEFYKEANSVGVKPILGCEAYTTPGNMLERKKNIDGTQSNHLLLLAKNKTGYKNLIKLCSLGHLKGFYYKPRIDMETLAKHAEGLIGTTTCLKGEIPQMILKDKFEDALKRAGQYKDIFGPGDYYVEIQDHGIKEQRLINRGVLDIAKRLNLSPVATNDVHYLEPSHARAHEALLCLQRQTTMNDPQRMRYPTDEFYMKSGQEMAELFRDVKGSLSNTLEVAEKCELDFRLGLDADLHFPVYDIPEGFTQKSYLIHIGMEGIGRKYQVQDMEQPKDDRERKIAERFYRELDIIERTGFINYFLVVWDFIRFAKDNAIPVGPGRGSGAGSIIAYALNITEIDPLKYHLLFERFLNPDRVSPPDFDIDFCQYRRGEVIDYVRNKYGQDHCAQIITFGTLGAKMVIRDVGRVLDIPLSKCDQLAKLVPEDPGMTLERAERANPDFKKMVRTDPDAQRIIEYARVLEGLPRNQGTHAAGVVIGETSLLDLIPLCRDKEKQTVTQFEMKPLEETGLLKMDFLGLKTLSVIQEAVNNIRETCGTEIDLENIPHDDSKTFEVLNTGDTVAVFQVESKGMREWLRKFQLSRFEDLIAMIALYRPGPMDMLPDFMERRHGRVKIRYDHPLLKEIAEETYGVMIYQEQVQQAAAALAGYTLAQGDILRRAMGKKVASIMNEQRAGFVEGCQKTNGIDSKKAGKIFDSIEKFAGYGFNKSHSTAYAVISWQTAWLKAHYPVEFMSAVLSCEMGNPDKLAGFIEETQRMGIQVLPPNVNKGGARFKPEGKMIRFGMAGIKNVGSEAVDALAREREASGPFKGLTDFCIRLDSAHANKRVLEALIQCGAFDFTKMYRSRLFAHIEFAMRRAASIQKDRARGQGLLFDLMDPSGESSEDKDDFPEQEPWPESKMLKQEKELIGFYISGHPLDQFQWEIQHFAPAKLNEFNNVPGGNQIRIAGMITKFRKLFTKRTQEAMAAFQLEGKNGNALEVVMFPSAYRDYGNVIYDDHPIVLCGEVARDEDGKLFASEAYPLAEAYSYFAEKLILHTRIDTFDETHFKKIHEVLVQHPGSTPVELHMEHPSGQTILLNAHQHSNVSLDNSLYLSLLELMEKSDIEIISQQRPCLRNMPVQRTFNGKG